MIKERKKKKDRERERETDVFKEIVQITNHRESHATDIFIVCSYTRDKSNLVSRVRFRVGIPFEILSSEIS